jgi:hypothetical protein
MLTIVITCICSYHISIQFDCYHSLRLSQIFSEKNMKARNVFNHYRCLSLEHDKCSQCQCLQCANCRALFIFQKAVQKCAKVCLYVLFVLFNFLLLLCNPFFCSFEQSVKCNCQDTSRIICENFSTTKRS